MKQDSGYWDSIAPQWTNEIFNTLRNDRNRVILTELERAAHSAESIADFGCGIGTYLPTLARLFDSVIGFDHSKICVELSRKRMSRKRNVSVFQAATAPKTHHAQFDAVLCVNVAIDPKPSVWQGVLRSATSLLKPNGRLILLVPSAESVMLVAKAERAKSDSDSNQTTMFTEPTCEGVARIEGVPTKHYRRVELAEALANLGLQVNRVRRVEYSWRSQDITPPREFRNTHPWDWIAIARNVGSEASRKAA